MPLDHIGGSIWPQSAAGIANLYPAARRAYVVILAPLLDDLSVGELHLNAGAEGVYPLPSAQDSLPVRYRLANAGDAARLVFVTQ